MEALLIVSADPHHLYTLGSGTACSPVATIPMMRSAPCSLMLTAEERSTYLTCSSRHRGLVVDDISGVVRRAIYPPRIPEEGKVAGGGGDRRPLVAGYGDATAAITAAVGTIS